jgi:hypothetical protein
MFRPSRSLVARLAGPVAFVGLSIGCGEETGTVEEPVALESFAPLHKDATCALLARCGFFPDEAACDASMQHDRRVVRSVAAVSVGAMAFDPLAAKSCLDALAAESCEADGVVARETLIACDAVFTERAAEGEPCYAASDCAGIDAACEGGCEEACCAGTCTVGSTLADGEACDGTAPCEASSHCGYDDMGVGTCQPKVGAGEPCTAADACTKGNACDPGSGKCFQQAATGAACNPALAADGCAHRNEYCDESASKCTPLPGVGQPCATNGLFTEGACAPFAECIEGTCRARPSEGDACTNGSCGSPVRGILSPVLTCSDMAVCVPRTPAPVCVE